MNGPLRDPRRERFCQLCATGIKRKEAYISAGYAKAGAASAAAALFKSPSVSSRLKEISSKLEEMTFRPVTINRERVISRLDELSRASQAEGNYSAAIRAEELLGRHLGLFLDRTEHINWDGDPRKLSAAQLAKLTQYFEEAVEAAGGEEVILKGQEISPGVTLLPAPEEAGTE